MKKNKLKQKDANYSSPTIEQIDVCIEQNILADSSKEIESSSLPAATGEYW